MGRKLKRPDLEQLPFKMPNFLTPMLMPKYGLAVKSGKFRYQDVRAEGTAQTDRTLGTAATYNHVASASADYSMDEKDYRAHMDDSEIEQSGGLDKAQQVMARIGKRAVFNKIEAETIAATFGDKANLNPRDIGASLISAVETAVQTVQDYAEGRVVLFGAQSMLNRAKRLTEVVSRMTFTGVIAGDPRDVRSISNAQLANVLGVDYCLGGPSTASAYGWLGAASAYDGFLGVMVLAEPEDTPLDSIQFGRMFVLEQDNVNSDGTGFEGLFNCYSWYNKDKSSEVVDTTAWIDPIVMNKELCIILTGLDEGNTITTTAS